MEKEETEVKFWVWFIACAVVAYIVSRAGL